MDMNGHVGNPSTTHNRSKRRITTRTDHQRVIKRQQMCRKPTKSEHHQRVEYVRCLLSMDILTVLKNRYFGWQLYQLIEWVCEGP